MSRHLLPGEVVRALLPGEEDAFLDVLCAAFGLDAGTARPLFLSDPFFDLSHKRVLWTPEEGIVSVLTVIPSTLRVGKSLVPLGGIAGVATRPDRQGRGAASRLLSSTLSQMDTELPYTAAALFAVNRSFYRRLGWEDASRLALWKGEAAPAGSQEALPFRPAVLADRLLLHALHARLSQSRTGAAERDSRRWHIIDVMAPARQAWVTGDDHDPVQGYILCDRLDAEGAAFRIVELFAGTEAARRSLRAFLDAPPFAVHRWEWPAALSDFAALGLAPSPPAEEPGLMLRVCHAPRALALRHAADFKLHLAGSKSLTLLVRDPLLPGNELPIVLNAKGVHTGPPFAAHAVSLPVETLAQIYMGYFSATEAAARGLLTASTPAALELADLLFPSLSPCVLPADQF